ncbi:MAG: amidohydrolase family protein [Chloroflexi bacterium]|nr:amidohydrolase family protein [Chloroflexota bacterium]
MAPVIDFEHHYIPKEVIQDVSGEIAATLEGRVLAPGTMQFWKGLPANPLKKTIVEERAYKLDEHIAHMDEAGIDISVLTSTAGWQANLGACRFLNDKMAEAVDKYPKRLRALGHVPPLDPGAIPELRRAVKELGLGGVGIPCYVEGRNLDSRDLWPFYEAACDLNVPIFVHPAIVPPKHEMAPETEYDLHRALIREFDLMTAVTKLVLGGVIEAFPDIKIVTCHFGGGVAFVRERIQRWEVTFEPPRRFSEDFSKLYFTMGGYEISTIALQCSLMGIGADRLIFGTDYPYDFRGGGPHLRAWVQQIRGLAIPNDDKDKILGRNAVELLGLE